ILSRKAFNLSVEPIFGIGRATSSFNVIKSDRYTQSFDVALIARQKIHKFELGLGWVSGLTNIPYDYTYFGPLGVTGRFGYQIYQNIILEAKANVQFIEEESKIVFGLNLIW